MISLSLSTTEHTPLLLHATEETFGHSHTVLTSDLAKIITTLVRGRPSPRLQIRDLHARTRFPQQCFHNEGKSLLRGN